MKFFISKKHDSIMVEDQGLYYEFTQSKMEWLEGDLKSFMRVFLVRGNMRNYVPTYTDLSLDDSFEEVHYEDL